MTSASETGSKAVNNSSWIRSLIAAHPNLKIVLVFVKIWAKCGNLIGSQSGNLSSYALNLMVIFYLQQRDLLPTVQSLQKDFPVKLCKEENIGFKEPKPSCVEWPPNFDIISGFFDFLLSVDSNFVVSPYDGELKSAPDFATSQPNFRLKMLNVQDPFDKNNNKTFSFTNLFKLMHLSDQSSKICAEISQNLSPESLIRLFLLQVFKSSRNERSKSGKNSNDHQRFTKKPRQYVETSDSTGPVVGTGKE